MSSPARAAGTGTPKQPLSPSQKQPAKAPAEPPPVNPSPAQSPSHKRPPSPSQSGKRPASPAKSPTAARHPAASAEAEEVKKLRDAIQYKKDELATMQRPTHTEILQLDADLREADSAHRAAEREKDEADAAHASLEIQFNRTKSNQAEIESQLKELPGKIDLVQNLIKQKEDEHRELSKQLAEAGDDYSSEKNAGEKFSRSVGGVADQLAVAIRDKIKVSIAPYEVASATPGDDAKQTFSAIEVHDIADGIVRDREAQHACLQKIAREAEARMLLKKEEEAKLREEYNRAVRQKLEEKDEAIKQAIYSFQEKRSLLLQDIEELRKVNSEQGFNLRRGHVEKHMEKMKFSDPATVLPAQAVYTKGSAKHQRRSQFQKQLQRSKETDLLDAKTCDLKTELQKLRQDITTFHGSRTELVRSMRSLEDHLKRDKDEFETTMRNIQRQIAAEEVAKRRLEKECTRLAVIVQQMTGVIETTKKLVEHVRVTAVPLPIEE